MATVIKKIREGLGLTQEQFAQKVSLTQAEISHLEVGRRLPSAKTSLRLIKIAALQNLFLEMSDFYPPPEKDFKTKTLRKR